MQKYYNFKSICLLNRSNLLRVTLFLLLLSFLTASLSASERHKEGQRITLKLENVTKREVVAEIERTTDYLFLIMDDAQSQLRKRVSVNYRDNSIDYVLRHLTRGTTLAYAITNKQVTIRKKATPGGAASRTTAAPAPAKTKQLRVVRGVVRDCEESPLGYASISVPGTNVGALSSYDGTFELEITEDCPKIVVSFIGCDPCELYLTESEFYEVVLEPDSHSTDDVVVIGYGTKHQRNLTSSVSSIRSDELERYNSGGATFDNLLGGAIKGVRINQSTGRPGDNATINIRGITSPASSQTGYGTNEPLYVIDGMPFFVSRNPDALSPLMTIPPSDIESIDVLKDAAATSIYGSRGANGVVIVNTKKGRRNEPVYVSAGYSIAVGNPIKQYTPLNTEEFKESQAQIITNLVDALNRGNISESDLYMVDMYWGLDDMSMLVGLGVGYDYDQNGNLILDFKRLNDSAFGSANTNWVKEVRNKNAITHNYNFGLRGGGEKTNFMFSFNATNQEGMYINEKMDSYSARLSIDTDISKRFKGGASLNYTYSKRRLGDDTGPLGDAKAWTVRPDLPVFDSEGEYQRIDMTSTYGIAILEPNPVAARQRENRTGLNQFMGNAYLEYTIMEGLKLHGDVNISVFDTKSSLFTPRYAAMDMSAMGWPLESSLYKSDASVTNTSINFRADWNKAWGNHFLSALVGVGWDRSFSESQSHGYEDFPDDHILTNISSASRVESYGGGKSKSGLNSLYGRLSYNYDTRYLVEMNFRSDASSKFGPGNRRAFFPSISLGWRLSDEAFLRGAEWMDDLKVRASIGTTGSTNVGSFSYLQFFSRSSYTLYGGEAAVSLDGQYPNRDVKWEKTTEFNFGLDFTFFDNRFYGSLDAYYRFTEGALAPSPIALETGAVNFYSNMMDLSNKGIEVDLGVDIIRNRDWHWDLSGNISFNRNILEKINSAIISDSAAFAYKEGRPVGRLLGYKVKKIFQSDEEVQELNRKAAEKNPGVSYYHQANTGAGDYMFVDRNGDGRITKEDQFELATPQPKFFGGFSTSLSYKSISLTAGFQYSVGCKAYFSEMMRNAFGVLGVNTYRDVNHNFWTPENRDARYARMTGYDFGGNHEISDRHIHDASYLRLKNLMISYRLPQSFLSKVGISAAQLYLNVTNLWTLTSWPGLDPELVNSQGVVYGTRNSDPYPLSRTISFGVRLEF